MTEVQKVDLTKVKPYGDTMNDGMVQLGFYQYQQEMRQ